MAVFVTTTLAPGMTAPVGSVTLPTMAPRVSWAVATQADRRQTRINDKKTFRFTFTPLYAAARPAAQN
jgi:hypothetical protein